MQPSHRKPTHPGIFLGVIVLPGINLTQKEISKRIDVSRNTLSGILNEKLRLTPDVAARLGRLLTFDPATLLRMQVAYDLWEIEHSEDNLSWIKPISVESQEKTKNLE
jgi:addiction module HigA family antidote